MISKGLLANDKLDESVCLRKPMHITSEKKPSRFQRKKGYYGEVMKKQNSFQKLPFLGD